VAIGAIVDFLHLYLFSGLEILEMGKDLPIKVYK
jgi:hypothetical protein